MIDGSGIKLATVDDYDEVKYVLDRANELSLKKSGYRLWTRMDYVYGQLYFQIENKECYIACNDEAKISSVIALSEKTKMWDETGNDNLALYFTKLMKDPKNAQSHEGLKLLVFAAREAERRGKEFLRCDTVTELEGLVNYYYKLGFKDKGRFSYDVTNRPGIKLEAKATDVLKLSSTI